MVHWCYSHSAVSRRCMQITVSNQSGNNVNQYLACNHWKHCSVLSSRAFSGDIENYWSITTCHLQAFIEDDHIKRPRLSPYQEAKVFSRSVQDQGGVDQANWTPYICLHGPRTFSSNWISLKTSQPMPQTDSWSSPPSHVGTQAPELEPSARVLCAICWWIHSQPLQLSWACPSFISCRWKASGLLHPRNRWNSWERRPE